MIHITWSGLQEDESTAHGDTRGAFATVPRAELAFGAKNALAPPPPAAPAVATSGEFI
jgi:hypothetical protein